MNTLPALLVPLLEKQKERLAEALPGGLPPLDEASQEALDRLLLASDYALDQLCRAPRLIGTLGGADTVPALAPDAPELWAAQLRRYRHAESVRLIHRDVNGIDSLDDTLTGASALATICIGTALEAVSAQMRVQHGTARNAEGQAQQLVVFGLGKLGGGELNFSSDVDLVFAYPQAGQSDGRRPLENAVYFQRLGQRLIQLLDEITADGMVYRVDMRLRPFGQVGRLALSFTAMEHYFQREGRDWERYAWIKARPLVGDLDGGEAFLRDLRPFIYRRYLDFGAIEGLRELKAMIDAEVQRKELDADLKLGRGGIREIEFIVQLHQLIRGGRESALRERGLVPSLMALREAGYIPESSADALLAAYRFLRRLENRLQMLREEQTHVLPADPLDQARLAFGLGFADWSELAGVLAQHRDRVSREFSRVFAARESGSSQRVQPDVKQLAAIWRYPDDGAVASQLDALGFADGMALARQLQSFVRLPALATMSARARARLDRVMPILLATAAGSHAADAAASRILTLVQAVLRRSSYLALLDERPAALARLVEVMSRSRWMAERLCEHPLLLDDLLDVRADETPPTRAEVEQALKDTLASAPGSDVETRIHALSEFRQSFAFRVARARLVDRQSAAECTRQLAFVAEAVVGAVLALAEEDLSVRHGRVPEGGLAVIAYGSVGGKELGFDSDLDLVFLYHGVPAGTLTDGPRPLDAARYYTRVVQKVLTLLAMPTPAGRLYEVDLRLRPDGGSGLLVSSVDSFSAYQRERAWTWEQQALVRARALAGDARVMRAFAEVRQQVLCRSRVPQDVLADVAAMRRRMRASLDRSRGGHFDLKQGAGGLVDLEFVLQAAVLMHAHQMPSLASGTRTPELLEAVAPRIGLNEAAVQDVHEAHEYLLGRALDCTLDGRQRLVEEDADLHRAQQRILAVWQAMFDGIGEVDA